MRNPFTMNDWELKDTLIVIVVLQLILLASAGLNSLGMPLFILEQATGCVFLLFIPGIILFSTYWLITRPRIKNRRIGQLSGFLLFLMFDSLLVIFFGLLNYPPPGASNGPAGWAVEAIAALGFLCYLAAMALWHWKRWGLLLFQGASIALAVFVLLGGKSLVLAAVIVAGVIGLSLVLRPMRDKLN